MNQQLQLGPIEHGPFTAPAQQEQTEAPVLWADPLGEGNLEDPLANLKVMSEVPPNVKQLEYAASIYNMAAGGEAIGPQDVLDSLEQDIGIESIQHVLAAIQEEDDVVQKEMILDTIGNPRLQLDAKLELVRAYESITTGRQYDVNAVERQALHNVVALEADTAETPEDFVRLEVAAEEVESIPENIDIAEDYEGMAPEELYAHIDAALGAAYGEAEQNASLFSSDFAAMLIPFRTNIPVYNIAEELGLLDDDMITRGAYGILPGEGLALLRRYVESVEGDPQKLAQALDVTLKHLKPNSGVFSDGNDFITMHLLSEIFYKRLSGGQDYLQTSIDPANVIVQGLVNPSGIAANVAAQMSGQGTKTQSTTQFLDNLGGLLDLSIFGAPLKGTIKVGGRLLPRSFRRLNRVSPKTGAELTARILANPAMAERMGADNPAQWAENILPSHRTLLQDGWVDGADEVMTRAAAIRRELEDIAGRTSLTAQERADAFEDIKRTIQTAANAQPFMMHGAKNEIVDTGTGVSIKAIFGRDAHHPFTTLEDAKAAAATAFGSDAPVKFYQLKKGKLVPVEAGDASKPKGQYLFEIEEVRPYESAPNVIEQLTVNGKSINSVARIFGRFWPSILPKGSVFSPDILNALSTTRRERDVWSKLTQNLTTNLNSLSRGERAQLSAILREGEKAKTSTGRGKVFTVVELQEKGLSEKGILAYYESRGALDIMHDIANKRTRTQWQGDGQKHIWSPSGPVGIAKPRRNAREALNDRPQGITTLYAFDPVKRAYVALDESGVQTLYANGMQLARLKTPMIGKGADEASHVIIDPKAGTSVRELPYQVINKVEGYYPHMWDSNYVVYGLTKGGNRVAIGLAKTESEAKAAAARVAASKKASKFDRVSYEFDRGLRDPAYRASLIDDMYINLGGPVYGERTGGLLKNYSKSSGDHMVDPIEAMVRGMELVGQQVTKQELVQHMRTKLLNFINGEGLRTARPGFVPRSADEILDDASKRASVNRARVYLEQINMFERVPDAVDEALSKLLKTSGIVVGKLLDRVPASRKTLRAGISALERGLLDKASKGFDPLAWLSTLAHKTIIASNPGAHLALQSAQSLMMLGINPRAYGNAVVRGLTPFSGLFGARALEMSTGKWMTKAEWKAYYKAASKFMGMPPEEVEALLDAFWKSGLVDAVSHNNMIRQNLRSAAEANRLASARTVEGRMAPLRDAFGRVVRGADEATFGTLGKIGFETGENINQMVTFLSLYYRDRAAKKAALNNPDYVRSLVGKTSEITGNMIPEMGLAYQRGWLKTALQFVSFQHKMLAMMMPEFLGGSRQLTAGEKAGIIFAQFLLYGRRGAPHIDAFYRVVEDRIDAAELPAEEKRQLLEDWEKLKPVTEGLIMDTGANYVLKELFGEGTPEFGFSTRLAPGGGSEFMLDRMIAIANNPLSAELFGMGGNKASQLYQWGKKITAATLLQAQQMDDVPLEERAEELAKVGASTLFSQYNKYLAVAAAKKMEGWTTAGGNISQGYSSDLEGALFLAFGINTRNREELYEARAKFEQQYVADDKAKDRELRSLANTYFQQLVFTSLKVSNETTSTEHYDMLMDKWMREQNLLFSMLDEDDAERVNELVEEKIRGALKSNNTAEQELVRNLTSTLRVNGFGSEGPNVSSYLRRQRFVQENPVLMNMVEDAFQEAHGD